MPGSDQLLSEIKEKIRAMRESRTALEREYGKMSAQLQEMKSQLDSKSTKISHLEMDIKKMNMARSIGGEDSGAKRETKLKINEMVKEIDKCIAMLNS